MVADQHLPCLRLGMHHGRLGNDGDLRLRRRCRRVRSPLLMALCAEACSPCCMAW